MKEYNRDVVDYCLKTVIQFKYYDEVGKELSASAVVIRSKGIAVTNYHNIKNASTFELYDGDNIIEYERIVAYSKKADLLIFKLKNVKDFPDIKLSKTTVVREPVFAIGGPTEFKNSVTEGTINGKNRSFKSDDHPMGIRMENLLQISTPILPGNSGGGLFNSKGELIGITTCTDTHGQNINFAIPIEDVLKLIRRAPRKVLYKNGVLEKEVVKFQLNVFNRNYEQALLHINNCLKLSKNETSFMFNKVKLLFDLQQTKEALIICNKLLKNNYDKYDILVELNNVYIRADRVKESLNVALMLYKKYPKDYDVCVSVGTRYIEVSQYNKAIIYFNKAKKINRNKVEHLIRLARMYILQGRYLEAEEILKKIKKRNPNEHYAIYLLSELYYYYQNFEKSFKYINKYFDKTKHPIPESFEIDLKYEFSYQSFYEEYMGTTARIQIIASLKEYKEALNDIKYLLYYYPNESTLYWIKSHILLKMNKPEKALENAFKSIKLNPNDRMSYCALSKIYLKINKPYEAILAINKALKDVPNHIPNLLSKAEALFEMKRYTEVVNVCRKILKYNDRHFEALDLIRKCCIEKGNHKLSLVYAKKQLVIKPHDSMSLYNVSNILFKMGKPKEALPYLNKALKWNPHIDVHILRGKINSLLGDNRSAIEDFKKADKIEKDNVDVYHYRGMAYYKTQKYLLALNDLETATHLNPSLETELGPIITEARILNGLIQS